MRRFKIMAAALSASSLAGCGPLSGAPALETAARKDSCAGGDAPSPLFGACRPEPYLRDFDLKAAPHGCQWTPQEALLSPVEGLAFMALTCGARAPRYRATDGKVFEDKSAIYEPAPDMPVIEVFNAPAADPLAPLKAQLDAISDPAEKARCMVQLGQRPDEWKIGPVPVYRKRLEKAGEAYATCGPYGERNDSIAYWAVRDGKAFFFQLGQDDPDFIPESVTLMRRGPDGWSAVSGEPAAPPLP